MVNAGALATTSLAAGDTPEERLDGILGVMRACAGDPGLRADEETAAAELRAADHNRATAYLMRAAAMIEGDVEELHGLYLRQCSVHVTCATLSTMAATLANGCVHPTTGDRAVPRDRVRDLLSVMYTCGMYDSTGEWAYDVGLPAKSGVSGGILVVVPGKMGIGVWSPGLDAHGNSARGVAICEEISKKLGLHLFATDDEDRLTVEAAGDRRTGRPVQAAAPAGRAPGSPVSPAGRRRRRGAEWTFAPPTRTAKPVSVVRALSSWRATPAPTAGTDRPR
jgi:glutaminase